MTWLLIFIVVLAVLVLAHEYGHFFTARLFGMKVEEFGFGFPPRAKAWVRKSGLLLSLNWLPLGGFVKIKGESGEHKQDTDSFSSKSAWKRIIVLAAGVLMNIVLAAVLYSVGFMVGLPSIVEDLPAGARVSETKLQMFSVVSGSPADRAGLESSDVLLAINGQTFEEDEQARAYIAEHGLAGLQIDVERTDGSKKTYQVTAQELVEIGRPGIGVQLVKTGEISFPPHLAVYHGTRAALRFTAAVAGALWDMLARLVTGQGAAIDLSGPVGIAVMTGKVAEQGFSHLLNFMAVLSINLAVLNILPFPALDGGRILFVLIEKIRRKAIDQKTEAIIHNVGFAFLMLLVLLVTVRDVARLGAPLWNTLRGAIGS